ncbi:ETC complex I subunit [Roseomonas sp. E05]|uniref:NADH dehydrogenase ubiquinone Fe-S protein 4 n=1 Tax=Roseomonas sp. E05 TaxID=3046310 RepID=UPI0024B9BCE1|nr:NADH dehydrogenase ubiquinone Fe-S protein 4 [Roseomonas sp. E05]MDJ0390924.1 ETC complex I subunit [Roseomonas sp. E05]
MQMSQNSTTTVTAEAFGHAVPQGSPANDRFLALASRAFPSDAHAIIRCPGPSVLSSGRARARQWILEFAPRSAPFIEPLMGWVGGTDPLRQVRLHFPSREAAVAYAEREGLSYEVQEPTHLPAAERRREPDGASSRVTFLHRGSARPAANDSAPVQVNEGRRVA